MKSWIWFCFLRFSLELFCCWQTIFGYWAGSPELRSWIWVFLLLKFKRQQENCNSTSISSGVGVAAVWVQGFLINWFIHNVCIRQLGGINHNEPHKCRVLTFRCSQVNQNHFIFLHGLESILETSLKVWFQYKWLFVWRPLKIQAVFQEGLAESRGIVLFFFFLRCYFLSLKVGSWAGEVPEKPSCIIVINGFFFLFIYFFSYS